MAGSENVAGIRLPDGKLVFVSGVPASSEFGESVRFSRGGDEAAGTVAIPVALVEWCDPETICGTFIEVPAWAQIEPPSSLPPVLASFVAELDGPNERERQNMLATAWAELGRLDDE